MNVDIGKLVQLKLSLEGYFVLYCLYNEESSVLLTYINNINKIPTKVFKQLVDEKYLEFTGKDDCFTLDNIQLTDKFKLEVLKIVNTSNLDFNKAFEQLREHYPTKTPNSRRLHQDIARCKKLYQNVIGTDNINLELHSVILQCINFEINERTKNRSLDYMQMLPTWLQQKSWEKYIEDVNKIISEKGYVDKKEGGNKGFIDDI